MFQPAPSVDPEAIEAESRFDLDVDDPGQAGQSDPDDLRGRLRAAFEEWMDAALAEEPAPDGIPPEILAAAEADIGSTEADAGADLYTLFAALTGLTGEIRLQ